MRQMPGFLIKTGNNHPALSFAGQELADHLHRLDASARIRVAAAEEDAFAADPAPTILEIGLLPEYDGNRPAINNRETIEIDVVQGCGRILGSDPGAALIAVYRFLFELGCRWVRPGESGALIPQRPAGEWTVKLRETADTAVRGQCIEGAVSLSNMLESIAWSAKVGFNTYMIEFRTPYTFFERWYKHRNNPNYRPEPLNQAMVNGFVADMEAEIAKRGLRYHAVGHAWTCEPFGIPGLRWEQEEFELDERTQSFMAEVSGKRGIWHGVPLNTNLCYANEEARRIVVEAVADYSATHPQVDFLHVWLADGTNNHCECAECVKRRPSDFYILLLNEIDAELTARGLDTRIVFLLYVDLLWEPETERLNNPDRFALLFAPITRSYSASYDRRPFTGTLPPYERNKLRFPRDVRENIAWLRAWQKVFTGPVFAYEYHFMWDHYKDPGYFAHARILHEDIRTLRSIGLEGFISDQTQRSFFPNGFGMHVMARTMWNTNLSFAALADEYFTAAYGAGAEACRTYLEQVSEAFDPVWLRGEKPRQNPAAAARLSGVQALVDDFRPTIRRNRHHLPKVQAESWRLLDLHADLILLFAQACMALAAGDMDGADAAWRKTADFARQIEPEVQPEFDVCTYIASLQHLFIQVRQDPQPA